MSRHHSLSVVSIVQKLTYSRGCQFRHGRHFQLSADTFIESILCKTKTIIYVYYFRYGRRPAILLMIFLQVPLSIATSFPGNYWVYIVLRIFCGLFFPALYQMPFILALELMPPARRTNAGKKN